MCKSCGCNAGNHTHDRKMIDVNQSLLKANEETARSNRKEFDEKGILAINLISSPGSGKTTLIEKTIDALKGEISIGVLEGDIETELDAERIRAKGAPAYQLTTGGACHLESSLVHRGFLSIEEQLNGKRLDILFIENVGNLVCPSFFDLGEHLRVVLISVPEGHDKPVKYPKAIKTSQLLIISKSDLIPYIDFDSGKIQKDSMGLNPSLKIIMTSAITGEGLGEWFAYLKRRCEARNSQKQEQ